MSTSNIQQSIERVITFLTDHPDRCRYTDKAATAVVEEGLRCRADDPDGAQLITDMPKGVGGGYAAPSPGWILRAALANCAVTVITMRAAQLGVTLSTLEVTVDSDSDDRGLLGMDETVPAGPLRFRTKVKIGAEGISAEVLHDIVAYAEAHSPIGDVITRAVPAETHIEIV